MAYVGNLVALLKHIIAKQASGIFIAGDRQALSTTQLTQLIAKTSNINIILLKVPAFLLGLAKKIKPSIVDRLFGSLELGNTNTNQLLDFVPPFSTEEGIREMVEWYKSNKA